MPTRKQKRQMAQPPPKRLEEGNIGLYIRRSEDDEKSKSCDDQERTGRRIARGLGFPDHRIKIYREEEGTKGTWTFRQSGKSGPYRKQLTSLVDDMRAGSTTVVWTWNVDRYVRDPEICIDLANIMREESVRLLVNGREIDMASSDGLASLVQDSISARRQRDRASQDIIRDKQFRAEDGMFTRDPSCYGWRSAGRDTQEAIPQWQELAVVEMSMQWFAYGDGAGAPIGLNQIANRLMRLGISLSVGARGHECRNPKLVTPAAVERIITNCMHVGRWLHGDVEWDFKEKLFVSRFREEPRTAVPIELYDAVQKRLDTMPERTARVGNTERLCKGIAVCGCCGRPSLVNVKNNSKGDKLHRYYCHHRVGVAKTCSGQSYATIVVDELEAWVRECLEPTLTRQLEEMKAEALALPYQRELQHARRALAEAVDEETKKLDMMLESSYDADQRKMVSEKLAATRQKLAREVERIEDAIRTQSGQANWDVSVVSTALLREALSRFAQWIAHTDRGIVILTRSGEYLCAPYEERDLSVYSRTDNRRKIARTLEVGGRDWLSEPALFSKGRRSAAGKTADKATDESFLPQAPELTTA